MEIMEALTEKLEHPLSLHYTQYTLKAILVCTLLYAFGIGIYYANQKNYRRGEEHGSAKWGDAAQLCRKYQQKPYADNILLTQNFRMGFDCFRHKRNLNVLVVGGSGAGKSRSYAIPNIMQCNCSMVVTDPKAELLRKTGGLLEKKGYEVRVFDLIHPDTSFGYNPFEYVTDDKDVLKLITNLIRNTTPKGAQSSDPFWEKSETALLQALMLYPDCLRADVQAVYVYCYCTHTPFNVCGGAVTVGREEFYPVLCGSVSGRGDHRTGLYHIFGVYFQHAGRAGYQPVSGDHCMELRGRTGV